MGRPGPCPMERQGIHFYSVTSSQHAMHWCRFINPPLTRRQMLAQCANGFGAAALAALLAEESYSMQTAADATVSSTSPQTTHHPPRATSVIMLYMDGGPSQV